MVIPFYSEMRKDLTTDKSILIWLMAPIYEIGVGIRR